MSQASAPSYLVIGPAIAETVTHQETQLTRRDIGAVAGQMATALARHNCQVTLLTATGTDESAQHTLHMLADAAVTVHAHPTSAAHGWARITTQRGEPRTTRGHWPAVATAIHDAVPKLTAATDWILMDCNLGTDTAQLILSAANRSHRPVTINATTRNKARLIWTTRQHPKAIATMNASEANALLRLSGATSHQDLTGSLNADHILVTDGQRGWRLHRRRDTELSSPAPPIPPNTDFIGCGDYATAGLTHAIAAGLSIRDTINSFVTSRMMLSVL